MKDKGDKRLSASKGVWLILECWYVCMVYTIDTKLWMNPQRGRKEVKIWETSRFDWSQVLIYIRLVGESMDRTKSAGKRSSTCINGWMGLFEALEWWGQCWWWWWDSGLWVDLVPPDHHHLIMRSDDECLHRIPSSSLISYYQHRRLMDTIRMSGSGDDADDGRTKDKRCTWKVLLRRVKFRVGCSGELLDIRLKGWWKTASRPTRGEREIVRWRNPCEGWGVEMWLGGSRESRIIKRSSRLVPTTTAATPSVRLIDSIVSPGLIIDRMD